jgi:hypothetical protein
MNWQGIKEFCIFLFWECLLGVAILFVFCVVKLVMLHE